MEQTEWGLKWGGSGFEFWKRTLASYIFSLKLSVPIKLIL